MKKNLIISILLICSFLSNPQTKSQLDFDKFAKEQDAIMMKAYDAKDTKIYLKTIDYFTKKYNELSTEDQNMFKGYYANFYYNLCCTYSLLNDKKNALLFLEKAINYGEKNFKHIQVDSDLDNLRNEEKYKTIVKQLKDTYDYLSILKRGEKYNLLENRDLSKFTYQSENNPNLIELRQKYKLDSVAGKGNEVSKIINLMHFVHYLVPHNGSAGLSSEKKNAISMISACKNEKKEVNCRGMAMILNDCYLSLGIKSRYVSCIPKDSLGIDADTHVINMVYSNQLKKWLWIDPTFNAYVMNEKGDLLSIEEVRERLINDKTLILNPDANHNRKESQNKEYLLYTYMAKNLYILECPLSSEYDYETINEGKEIKFLRLIPIDYFKKSLDEDIFYDEKTKVKRIKYKTNNSEIFWQKP